MERDSAISGNMHESAGHVAERNKLDGERQTEPVRPHFHMGSKEVKDTEAESRTVVAGGWGVEVGRDWPRGYGVAVV